MRAQTKQITVGHRRISVSNLDKTLYPGEKFTKDIMIQGPVYTPDNVDDPALQAQLWQT